ncbi:MAG: type II secretion system F family protein, partial [Gemmatimonadaceae bacterium]
MAAASRFAYRAARPDGTLERGVLTADTRDDAARTLASQGLWTVSLGPTQSYAAGRTRLHQTDVALGLRVLSTLLDSGLPVSKALTAMPDLAPDTWSPALPTIARAVREGAPLGVALEQSGLPIPPVVIGMVQAGEAGSGLARAVRRAADMMEESAATRSAIRSALVYPAILGVAGTVSVGVLVGVVLPRFGAILTDLGQTLPPTTRLVLEISSLARAAALPGVIATLIMVAVWRGWVSTARGAVRWHALLLRTPLLGGVRRSAASGQVCVALSALLESGVPLSTALVHAARASGDAAITERLTAAREAVIAGHRLSSAFADQDALTPVVCRLARAGEETGALVTMLAHAGRLEAERATRRVRGVV